MSDSIWLSVVMPTYNGSMYVARALESVAIQSDRRIECVVVDDGSTDTTAAIVNSFSDRLTLRVINKQRRGNWIACTNDGLRIGRGKYACFLHQDDYWLENRIATMKSLIDQHRDAALYVHPVHYVDQHGKHLGPLSCPLPKAPAQVDSRLLMERLVVQNFFAINGPLFDRELALALGGLNPALWYTADWDFWLKMANGRRTIYSPKILAAYRLHSGALTVTGSKTRDDFSWQLKSVLSSAIASSPWLSDDVLSRAEYSANLNIGLSERFHGNGGHLIKTLGRLALKSPLYWCRLLRDTRLHERTLARIRARLR